MSSPSHAPVVNNNSQMKPVKLSKKHHLLKDRVGMVKTSTRKLPEDQNHVFGYRPPQDTEGTGDIMGNWVTSNPSLQKESSLSWINSNVLAVQHGCINAVEMRMYAEAHPNIRMKEVLTLSSSMNGCNHEGPFGVKTKTAEDSMATLIQGAYTNFSGEDSDYPNTENILKLSSFPDPVATRSSLLIADSRAKEKAKLEHPSSKFCMKKFQNIEGKLYNQVSPKSSPSKAKLISPQSPTDYRLKSVRASPSSPNYKMNSTTSSPGSMRSIRLSPISFPSPNGSPTKSFKQYD